LALLGQKRKYALVFGWSNAAMLLGINALRIGIIKKIIKTSLLKTVAGGLKEMHMNKQQNKTMKINDYLRLV